jgi:mannan endo-1,4-beta-mannosidase
MAVPPDCRRIRHQHARPVSYHECRLTSTSVVQPLVRAVSNHRALGAWEIVNEPEGSVRVGESNGNPCFDTTAIASSGAGWTQLNIPME